MTLAMAGATIATLRVSIADDRPILRITPSDSLDFGTVRLDSSAERTLVLANIGSAPLIVDSISIEPLAASSGEFSVQVATPLVINPNGSQSITLRFAPRQSGERRARLVMSTNSSPTVAAVVLHGVGTTPLSIAEPVPAVPCTAYGTGTFIAVECACGQPRRLELWQLRGQHVMEVTVPLDQVWLDATHLPRGTYLCRIRCGDRIEWSGIVVLVP
jgi:hypothetical protein